MFRVRNLPLLLSLIPAASVLVLVFTLSVDVLCWDEWEMVPLVQKSYEGRVKFSDLIAQYHEHRPLVSRIFLLVTVRLTHWNTAYELAINFALAAGIAVTLGYQILSTSRHLVWVIPLVSVAIYSMAAYENWLMGWQQALFLTTLATIASIVILANEPGWGRLCCAIFLGWIATYSLANGMLVWPIGTLLLVLNRNKWMLAAWTVSAVLAIGSYFIGYQKPPEHPALAINPEVVCYVLKFIGGICAQINLVHDDTDGDLAIVCGTGAVLTTCWAYGVVIARKIVPVRKIMPYAAMSCYSVGTAILCGIGRTGFGSNQALSSRYCTMAAPFWISLIAVLAILLLHRIDRWSRTIAQWSLAIAVFVLLTGSVIAVGPGKEMNKVLVNARHELNELVSNPEFKPESIVSLCPRPQEAVERYPVLVRHRLLVFRDQGIRP